MAESTGGRFAVGYFGCRVPRASVTDSAIELESSRRVASVMAAATVTAGFIFKIRLAGNPAQFERFGNVFLD